MLIRGNVLTKEDIHDPWGNQLKIEGEWDEKNSTYRNYAIFSPGVDGISGTPDDISVSIESHPRLRFKNMPMRQFAFGERIQESGAEPDLMIMDKILPSAPVSSEKTRTAPRVRKYFPETLYFNPLLITDVNGKASLKIPMADS